MNKELLSKYKKPIVIISGLVVLNIIYGFDAKFIIINLLWLLVQDEKYFSFMHRK